MAVKGLSLTVQAPIPQKKIGRFRDQKGVYLIRHKGSVIYIGTSFKCLYRTIMRMFQKGRKLDHIDYNRVEIEIITTSLRFSTIKNVLIRHFKPLYNEKVKHLGITTEYERRHFRRVLDSFLEQSRFEPRGNHQTDSKPFKQQP